MADDIPLASWMWRSLTEPPRPVVDHVIVNIDMLDGDAEVIEKVVVAASPPDSAAEGGHTGVPEDGKPGDGGRPVAWDVDDDDPLDEDFAREKQTVGGRYDQSWIWRVHPSVRQQGEAYEPKLVSIGPLHHGKKELSPMEGMKDSYKKHLLGRSTKNNHGNYNKVIYNCEGRAREQYAEKIDYMSSKKFVSVLVVDGCFIIEYFLRRFFGEDQEAAHLFGVGWGFSHLRRDLMLLENQIPFFVLEELFAQTAIPNRDKGTPRNPASFKEMALKFLNLELPGEKKAVEVHHLLHLQYLCLTSDLSIERPVPSQAAPYSYPIKMATRQFSRACIGLINAWLWHPAESEAAQKTIPCATELERYGVKLKRKVLAKDREVKSYMDVSFTEGTLEIPVTRVGASTSSKLCNFIALEQCHPCLGHSFISYAIFMDNLINSEADVALLRKYGIVDSKLSSDKQAAEIFTSLCRDANLYYKPQYRMARSLFKSVTEYCGVPHRRWRQRVWSTYLRSPWTPISVLAAVIALAASITQVCLTVSDHVKGHGVRR